MNKLKNSKGFTLVEILAVITIIALLSLILIPSIDSIIRGGREDTYEIQLNLIKDSLGNWAANNVFKLPSNEGEKLNITLGELKLSGFIDVDVRNPKTDECFSNDIVLSVVKTNNKYVYEVDESTIDFFEADICDVENSPTIDLVGKNFVNLEINSKYVEPGYSAKSINGSDITSSVVITSNVDNTKLGSYTITYSVTEEEITKTRVRTVNVVDTTGPEITFPKNTVIYSNLTSYDVMEDVTVTDNSGETPTVTTSSNLALGVIGEYKVIYTATDTNGNSTTKVRKITIERARIFLKYYISSTYTTDDFHSSTYSSKIKTVSFINNMTIPETAIVIWDLSAPKDNSIKGWLVSNSQDSTMYDLYIGSNGIILANPYSNYLFYYLSSTISISFNNFDTSNATSMAYMFNHCNSLINLDVSKFDTSKVTNMHSMFEDCTSLTSLDLSKFDTSNVTYMYAMFRYNKSLTNLDVSKFDTSNVTDMSYMFYGCSGLTSLDVSQFDTSNVTNMRTMFGTCSGVKILDVSKFDTSKVASMVSMFNNCTSLTSLDVSKFDTSKVASMVSMFNNCTSLTSLDVSKFDTSNVTDMGYMFYKCTSLTSLDVSKFNTSNVTNMYAMFADCSSLTSLDVSKFNTSNVTDMLGMFARCSSLTSLDLSSFDTSKVASMGGMFNGCSSLTSLDLSKFNTSKVTDMQYMFLNCGKLTILDVSKFDTSKVTDMGGMFENCVEITNLDLSSFDTSKVTNMQSMFEYCSSLTSLDLSKFDTSKAERMNRMFYGASKLETIYVGSLWTTAHATSITTMFNYCGTSSVTLKS